VSASIRSFPVAPGEERRPDACPHIKVAGSRCSS
jgi:hypothetical protein